MMDRSDYRWGRRQLPAFAPELPTDVLLRRRVVGGFVAAVLLMSFLGFLSWHNAWRAEQDADWVTHTQVVLKTLDATATDLGNVDMGGRGFALSGSEPFLESYESGRTGLVPNLDRLRHLTADNRSQQQRLDTLRPQLEAKADASDELVSARRQTGAVPTMDQLLQGAQLMHAAQGTIQEMVDEEERLLDARVQKTHEARRWTISVMTLGSLLAMSFLVLAGFAINRQISVSVRARAQIVALNDDLESRVEERTAALRDSQAQMAGVIQSAMDSIITTDAEQNILLFNAAAEKMFRCRAAEALGQSISRFIPQRFHAAHSGHIKSFGDTGVTNRTLGAMGALWAVRADGEEFQIEASISQVEAAGRKMFTIILRDVTERKQAEEIRERLAAVVESSEDAIISKSLEGTISAWNRGAEKVFGYSASEIIGKPMLLLIPPERVDEEAEILSSIRRGDSVEHYETVRVRKDGTRIDVSATISPIRDLSGAIVGISKIARNITEHKHAERALRDSEERFQAMANGIQQLAWMAEADGSIVWYNQRWYDYTGTTFEDMREGAWESVHDPSAFPKVLEGWKNAIATKQPFDMEFPLRRADGTFHTFLTRVMPVKSAEGRVVRWFGTNTDISEQHKAKDRLAGQALELARQAAELRHSRKELEKQTLMLRSVLDGMAEGLVAADEQGKFILWNPAAEKILGVAANLPPEKWTEHYGLYLADTVTPFPADQIPLVRAIRGETSVTEMFVRKEGVLEGTCIEVSAGPLVRKDGVVCGGVAAFRDITQRKADEREIQKLNDQLELRVAERTAELEVANHELEAFSYSVSHDLRAPLRHISGFSRMLAEEFGPTLDPNAQRYLARIQSGTQKMGLLVDELLNLARVGRHALHRQPTRLNRIVAEVIAMLQPDYEGRQVEWAIADLPVVDCDPVLVKQIYQNLIANALKFSGSRGGIAGKAGAGKPSTAMRAVIEVSHTEEDGQLVFMVRDNGIGFNMKYVDKLFGVFQRLHSAEDFEGTGIGLVTVQRIVHKHGGRVWAQGSPDKGAAFFFTLGVTGQTESKSDGAAAGGQS
jgi:PAS domain S-box-containing protein